MNLLFETISPLFWLAVAVFLALFADSWGTKRRQTFESKKLRVRLSKLEPDQTNLHRN
jgi:hypothetical protein